jgi:hypothetical protein
LLVLLPIGAVAAWRRDPLVTCLLLGYALPTACVLALTNGNVGTLLRLRGLVTPIPGLGQRGRLLGIGAGAGAASNGGCILALIDDRGRLFGRVNVVDAAIGAFALVLLPIAYGTFLLFRPIRATDHLGRSRSDHDGRASSRRRQPSGGEAQGPRIRIPADAPRLDR